MKNNNQDRRKEGLMECEREEWEQRPKWTKKRLHLSLWQISKKIASYSVRWTNDNHGKKKKNCLHFLLRFLLRPWTVFVAVNKLKLMSTGFRRRSSRCGAEQPWPLNWKLKGVNKRGLNTLTSLANGEKSTAGNRKNVTGCSVFATSDLKKQ